MVSCYEQISEGMYVNVSLHLGICLKLHISQPNTAAAAKSLQSCPTLCDLIDGSPPGSSVPGILQARILEGVAMPSSRGCFQLRDHVSCLLHWQLVSLSLAPPGKPSFSYVLLLLLSHFSHVQLCVTPQMAAHHAPLSLGFSRQEHWSGLPFPSPMHESEK